MRILIVHNAYQRSGGEDTVVWAEKNLLREKGNEVLEYARTNSEIQSHSLGSNIALGFQTVWSRSSRSDLHRILEKHKPEVVHFHNTFPLISPSAYYACRDLGIPVVQTLHNYRIFCASATFFRDGHVCEDCLEKGRWQAVRNKCYRNSSIASATLAAMQSFHHWYGTWTNCIDRYVALSEFSRRKFEKAGLPSDKITVKPNFVLMDPGVGSEDGNHAVFLGRLSEEKGIKVLLQAWAQLNASYPLQIVGDGPLDAEVRSEVEQLNLLNVRLAGRLSREESMKILQAANVAIVPSNCYEHSPMSIAEAFACGTPVIASRLGAMQEAVADGRTGLLFHPGDVGDLASKLKWASQHPDEMRQMGKNARAEYEAKYTSERNYEMLMGIYARVIHDRKHSVASRAGIA